MFLVLGNVAVDEFMEAPVWPVPGATVLVGAPWRDLGGKGANQALVLSRCGVEVRFVATVGEDDYGRWIASNLEGEGVRDHLIRVPQPTDRSLIFIGQDGENAIASTSACSDALSPAHAVSAIATAASGDVLVMQGGLTAKTVMAACAAARARAMQIVFNPSAMREGFAEALPFVDLLVLNQSEAVQLVGSAEAVEMTQRLREAGARNVVITLGVNGSLASTATAEISVAAAPAIVRDTTGAGDTYLGVLAACLMGRGFAMERSMRCASAAAALTVGRKGTRAAFPTRAELDRILSATP